MQTADHVKEYMRIFERAPALKAVGLDDTYKVLADFGDAVLAGRSCKTGAKFVTWEWDFDRQGVHAGRSSWKTTKRQNRTSPSAPV